MNISELHQALNEIADEVSDDSRTRLASVTRRVRIARRGKVAGTLVTTCAAIAALVFLPSWKGAESPHQTPAAARVVGSLATITDGDLLVYTDAGGSRLLGEKVGSRGDTSISVIVLPRTGNLGWTQLCQSESVPGLRYHLSVNGKPVPSAALNSLRYTGADSLSRLNTTCDQPSPPMQVERSLSLSPTGNMAAWRAFDVQPHLPARFTLSATSTDDAQGQAALSRASLRLGVFEVPTHPVHANGIWVQRHLVDPAPARGAFVLVHHEALLVAPGRTQLTLPVPVSNAELYVRTFVVHGSVAGVDIEPGAANPREIATAKGRWHLATHLHPGQSTVQAGLAVVPPGVERRVVVLVYARYQ